MLNDRVCAANVILGNPPAHFPLLQLESPTGYRLEPPPPGHLVPCLMQIKRANTSRGISLEKLAKVSWALLNRIECRA